MSDEAMRDPAGRYDARPFDEVDRRCVDALRFLSVDMVKRADSGHPGLPLGAAPMAWVLWSRFLRHHPAEPLWPDRDRFVLSAGHGSALLYSLLFLTGYDLSLYDLQQFRHGAAVRRVIRSAGTRPGWRGGFADPDRYGKRGRSGATGGARNGC